MSGCASTPDRWVLVENPAGRARAWVHEDKLPYQWTVVPGEQVPAHLPAPGPITTKYGQTQPPTPPTTLKEARIVMKVSRRPDQDEAAFRAASKACDNRVRSGFVVTKDYLKVVPARERTVSRLFFGANADQVLKATPTWALVADGVYYRRHRHPLGAGARSSRSRGQRVFARRAWPAARRADRGADPRIRRLHGEERIRRRGDRGRRRWRDASRCRNAGAEAVEGRFPARHNGADLHDQLPVQRITSLPAGGRARRARADVRGSAAPSNLRYRDGTIHLSATK